MNEDERPMSAAELCLQLIMILPDLEDRRRHVRDFCLLYDIKEKALSAQRTGEAFAGIGRIIGKPT